MPDPVLNTPENTGGHGRIFRPRQLSISNKEKENMKQQDDAQANTAKCQSETNEEREDRRQATELATQG